MASEPSASEPQRKRRLLLQRILLRGAIYAALVYAAWCGALYFFQDRMIFRPEMVPASALKAPPPGVLVLKPLGGQAEAWLFGADNAAGKPKPLVVFCHGNAEVINTQEPTVECYLQLGCAVLLPEYRGYGRCGGKPSQAGIVADAVGLVRLALQQPTLDRSRVVIHGRSLGGGVAAQIAAGLTATNSMDSPRAVILESTFTSIACMAHDYWAPEFVAKHPFRTDRVVAGLHCPLLIFHGTNDTLIPVSHARQLQRLSPSAKLVEYPAGHMDFPGPAHWDEYWLEIRQFLIKAGVIQ